MATRGEGGGEGEAAYACILYKQYDREGKISSGFGLSVLSAIPKGLIL